MARPPPIEPKRSVPLNLRVSPLLKERIRRVAEAAGVKPHRAAVQMLDYAARVFEEAAEKKGNGGSTL
jgi:hypothetical protein